MKNLKARLNQYRQAQQSNSGSSSSSIDANRCEKSLQEFLGDNLAEQLEVYKQAKRCHKM